MSGRCAKKELEMPKLGMEPIRRDALVRATIAEIGEAGTLDVTVSQIARRAGVSSALAHHYFGGKDQIFLAAMRRILTDFADEVLRELRLAHPDHRAEAIIRACFAPSCFAPGTISAWMSFYVMAQRHNDALRLWRVYQARMRSNLIDALRSYSAAPETDAATLIALIDGLYIRAALDAPTEPSEAIGHALGVLKQLTKG
jgi:TetR/AcrR family transcriptional repressor of bet genes